MSWLSSLAGVFFVGHSLFGATNPQMLQETLRGSVPHVQVSAQIINGAPLKYNWEQTGPDSARQLLHHASYNAVILTEAIPLQNHLDWSDTPGFARRYRDLAQGASPETRVFLQETWHSLDSGTGKDVPYDDGDEVPWRSRLTADLPKWQGVVDQVNASSVKGTQPMQLLPAGQAMAQLHDAIDDGSVPGLRSIRDVFRDDIHPNDTGFYFLTMLQYAALTGESPVGLRSDLKDPYGNAYATPDGALARRLQEIAWDTARLDLTALDPETQADASPLSSGAPAPAPAPDPAPDSRPEEPPSLEFATIDPDAPRPDVPMALGLAGVSDWSPQQPFLDVFKSARPWIGHLPRRWGGVSYEELETAGYLDENGWPLKRPPEVSSIGTVILTDLPEDATTLSGRYRLRFDGDGIVEVGGRATRVRYGKNEVQFDFTPGPGPVDIRIQRTDSKGRGNHVRNISVVKLDHVAAYDAGAVFNPDWLDLLFGFRALRFMDWMLTNESTQSTWDDRPRPDDFTYALKGVPLEIMLELANRVGVDAWFNMPHLADDDYVRQFAQMARDDLWEDLNVYAEYSNEVWNWQFGQARWANEQAIARWGAEGAWLQFYAMRASQFAQIWSKVFADTPDRLTNVITTQTGWLGLEADMLSAPLWRAEDPNAKPPAEHFDAYAVTGYFGGMLGLSDRWPMIRDWLEESLTEAERAATDQSLTGDARSDFMDRHRYDLAITRAAMELRDGLTSGDPDGTLQDLLGRLLPYHAKVAEKHNLDLIMYEGGTHVVGLENMVDNEDLTAFFLRLNYSSEMGELYDELIRGWHVIGGTMFNAYVDVFAPSKWGSWGNLRHLGDATPRWTVLEGYK